MNYSIEKACEWRCLIKILFLTQYDEHGASSQVRVYQFLPEFKSRGVEFTVRPLLKKKADQLFLGLSRFAGVIERYRSLFFIFGQYLGRVFDVFLALRVDGVVVQKDVLPFGLGRLLFLLNQNVVFEFDDPIWLPHESISGKAGAKSLIVRYRKHCLDFFLKRARLVICDNPKMKTYVEQFNSNVLVFSSPVDVKVYESVACEKSGKEIAWIGSSGTTYLLQNVLPTLEKIAKTRPLVLHNIGGAELHSDVLEVRNTPWSPKNVVEVGSRCSFGFAPGEKGQFNHYKYAYKIWLYAALSIPTLASNDGLNPIAVKEGVTGLLFDPSSEESLMNAVAKLLDNPEKTRQMGANAYHWVKSEYDLPIGSKTLVDRILSTLEQS